MAQISLYMDDAMVKKLAAAAKESNCSVSKYVAELVSKKLSEEESGEIYKKQLLKKLCGALDDPSFTIPADIPWGNELPRKFDLL